MTASNGNPRRLGVALVGLGGAVATTAVAGVELLRQGLVGTAGLPLADARADDGGLLTEQAGLVDYTDLQFAGWDVAREDLAKAADVHRVLEPAHVDAAGSALGGIHPWPAVASTAYCRNVSGDHVVNAPGHRAAVETVRADLDRFRADSGTDVVVVNCASTERRVDPTAAIYASIDAFERALDTNDEAVAPSTLYAYAAITAGVPYGNFTPSIGADIPALRALAEREGVPVAGRDGKTGQTMVKTVLAPAFRARALHVDGWYSTNILGNRDGLALDDPDSLASKIDTKGSVLDDLLGYPVADHKVRIDYYRPRGDEKEAWDNIDLSGFLGQRMQLKVNLLARDSILAAPLVLEIARVLDCARRRGEGGVLEELGVFFKAPMSRDGGRPEHGLARQDAALSAWLQRDGR